MTLFPLIFRTSSIFILASLGNCLCAAPAATVTFDVSAQRYLGEESELQRDKFFNVHSSYTADALAPEDLDYLTDKLDVGLGRAFDGPFWYFQKKTSRAFPTDEQAAALSAAQRNRSATHPNYDFRDKRIVLTDHPNDGFSMDLDIEAAAQWAASYFEHFYSDEDRPVFYEPLNEPFVHAGEFGEDQEAVRLQMMHFYREIGKVFDERGLDVAVVGYASAWPSMELWDFKHWNERMKQFMDVAGEYMDGFSVHLYDGTNVTGQDNSRSGSNSEAILDLIETYSQLKWGVVKPHALTEYGDIVKGFPEQYSEIKGAQELNAINHLLFGFLDRQDRISISIPFITTKSSWHYNPENNYEPYVADLWRPDTDAIVDGKVTRFQKTPKFAFYETWSDVRGERFVAQSDNPDVLTHGFVDGQDAFLCLNNLESVEQQVKLDGLFACSKIAGVELKRLYVSYEEGADYSVATLAEAPSTLTLKPNETVILRYTFESPLEFESAVRCATHYSATYMQAIHAGQPIRFEFSSIPAQEGRACLRMSIGRKHDRSKQPVVTVNGNKVSVPENWAGYDQASRSDFFGAIEIPLPADLLASDTVVELTFPDDGGHVSSLVLVTETVVE